MILWFVIAIGLALIILGVISVLMMKGKRRPTDYYSLFIMGAIWLPAGILMWWLDKDGTIGNIFVILGMIYLVMGLAHKKEWEKNHRTWRQLTKKEKKFKIAVFIALGILILLGAVAFLLVALL